MKLLVWEDNGYSINYIQSKGFKFISSHSGVNSTPVDWNQMMKMING